MLVLFVMLSGENKGCVGKLGFFFFFFFFFV